MSNLGGVRIGKGYPVRIMGILNVSPESFLSSSISTSNKEIAKAALSMERGGADIIDIGGMSSAPYKKTLIPEHTEIERVVRAIRIVTNKTNLPISVDTCRATVAKAALYEGATIINDITGLHYDSAMRNVIKHHNPFLVLCAYSPTRLRYGDPVKQVFQLLKKSIRIATQSGSSQSNIVLDPAIGFFRNSGNGSRFTRSSQSWFVRDLEMLGGLGKLSEWSAMALLVSVSQKSFLGKILNEPSPTRRLAASIAAEATAAVRGASIIRTHNVADTKKALEALY